MKVRITFRSELVIEGKDFNEIVKKFESMPLFSEDAINNGNAEYVELVSIDDIDTGEDLMNEYMETY